MDARFGFLVLLNSLPVWPQGAVSPAMHGSDRIASNAAAKPAPIRSEMLTVTTAGVSRHFTVDDLKRLRQSEISVVNGHTKQKETYRGVLVVDILAATDRALPQPQRALRSYVRAQGTDFYWVLYSGAELDPARHNGSVLVALERDGQPLGDNGRFHLVSSDDLKPARWVRNLNSLASVPLN